MLLTFCLVWARKAGPKISYIHISFVCFLTKFVLKNNPSLSLEIIIALNWILKSDKHFTGQMVIQFISTKPNQFCYILQTSHTHTHASMFLPLWLITWLKHVLISLFLGNLITAKSVPCFLSQFHFKKCKICLGHGKLKF